MNNREEYAFQKGTQHEIYIGIKDQDSYRELVTVDEFREMIMEICAKKNIGFSLLTQFGGYSHNKGYTNETSLRIVVIGADEKEIFEIGRRMKQRINTDTIMVTRSEVEYLFI